MTIAVELRLEQCVRQHARQMPQAIAVLTPDRSISWSELDRAADVLAANLCAQGLVPGDRIGWLGRNRPEYPILVVAARRARLAIVGLNWRLSKEELDYVTHDARPKLVIADDEFRAAVPQSFSIVSSDALPGASATLAAWMADPPAQVAIDSGAPLGSDPVLLLYTSGTTGRPKGILYSLDGVEQMLRAPNPLEFQSTSLPLIVPPVFHIAGGTWTQFALVIGMQQILLSHGTPDAMLDAIERWKVTHSLFVPTLVQMAVDAQQRKPRDVSSLRMVAYGAAPMPPELLRAAAAVFRNAKFTQAYGMTEALGPVCHLPPSAHRLDAPAPVGAPPTGFPDPGVGLRIVEVRGDRDLPAGECGEVLIRTPWPRPEYWSLPSGSESAYDEAGWLHTGDIGFMDHEGCLHLVDRVGDLIITGGENVYPAEVESVLRSIDGVADAGVFSLPDAQWGEIVCAALVPCAGAILDHVAIMELCRERLAHYKCPRRIIELTDLPRNAAGKLLRRHLRERA